MGGQSDYLPPGLPFNRAKWPQEFQLKEHYDMRAAALIRQLYEKRISRGTVLEELKRAPDEYREFFRERLNYWREEREK
ncbi:hypothetical protein CBJ89_001966 [Salmonella enterica subsp. enterica serovar Essen]|nr:hypothetical protein [Salmonella enterica subsp. enterica serovar Middlesbrough]EBX2183599.1 hypothetical protein [Salmonella enterica subsp. enterica serovar Aba]EBY6260741.1 hypothetical protein [Salmonella enterica subsp. enterica serovar Warnow]EBZ0012550.1 hypothetical protein [Salmonella enterica subsp. enterica serovar Suberu]ECI7956920.1 hypothetical protein [Salmonella enterica subsp. enterica]EDU3844925.1 hypothetical protein [Salmonella enterica subsp. enterica serovar Essen]